MKKLLILLASLMLALSFIACGDDDDDAGDNGTPGYPPPAYAEASSAVLHVTLPDTYNYYDATGNETKNEVDASAAGLFAGLTLTTGIEIDASTTASGFLLEQFITLDAVKAVTPDQDDKLGSSDPRSLYNVFYVSNMDGFSNRTRFSSGMYTYDLSWDIVKQGYLVYEKEFDGKIVYPGLDVSNMFKTKWAYDVYLLRKIDVQIGDATDTVVSFETAATTDSYVDDSGYDVGTTKFTVSTISFTNYSSKGTVYYTNVKAISLDQFITSYVTASPQSYTYDIIAVDEFAKEDWTYEQIQKAYFLPDYEFVCQVDASGAENIQVSSTKVNFPKTIKLVSTSTR